MHNNKGKFKKVILLFLLAFSVRALFYALGLVYLPDNFQKFFTADTIFYYDPLALKLANAVDAGSSFLIVTRIIFLSYQALFYRFFGYQYMPVSIFHCFLGAISVVLLFLTARIFLKEKTAFFIGLVAAFQIVLIYWTPFVNTETSFLFILSLALFLLALFTKNAKPLYAFLLLLCLILIFFSRPQGIFFGVFMFLYFAWRVLKRIFQARAALYFLVTCAVISTGIITLATNFSQKIDKIIAQPYLQQQLHMAFYIDEMPQTTQDKTHLLFYAARLTLPPGIKNIPKTNKVPEQILTQDIADYFKNNFKKYFILAVSRVYTLFNPIVAEYSFKHNIMNLIFYGLVYILSVFGLIELWKIQKTFAYLISLALFSQVLLIGLTIVDYDFRLRIPIEFLLCVPVGVAIARIFEYQT